ncbi:hypothetical protein M404DRAFT_998604, partial [Pisolithus tinctorius Marx 270]
MPVRSHSPTQLMRSVHPRMDPNLISLSASCLPQGMMIDDGPTCLPKGVRCGYDSSMRGP